MPASRAAAPPLTQDGALIWITWINRGLETLWLLTVVLVPLVFLDREHALSEAVIAFVEVPKIALLRTLVTLMTILWLLEWGIRGDFPLYSWLKAHGSPTRAARRLSDINGWLRGQPTRWLVLAVWIFLLTTVLSTVLSASFGVSFWGEVPGQDGLAAYTTLAYLLLFGVISSHLKTRAQMWRLLGAIVSMGVLVAAYAVLQHYGQDFLGALEATGGGRTRVTSTLGNAVFAGAVMLMPITVSLTLATITLIRLRSADAIQSQQRASLATLALLGLWVIILAVQFSGIIVTFSRGPWLGTILAILGFLLLAVLFAGWRAFGWASLVCSLAGVLTWTFLQWSGSVSGPNFGPWLGVIIPVFVIIAGITIFRDSPLLGHMTRRVSALIYHPRVPPVVGTRRLGIVLGALAVAVVLALALYIAFPALKEDDGIAVDASVPGSSSSGYSGLSAQERFASITGEVFSGNLSNRAGIWKGSLRLMQTHPWFGFSELSLPWLRPIVGYGPDLFRYTYLLVSIPPDSRLLPAEPDHAHNFFLNQGVEQGILGLISAVGIFAAFFAVASIQLIRGNSDLSLVHLLVLIGLVSVIAGRCLEQTVGVPRVSDLTVFWVLLGVFMALPRVFQQSSEESGSIPRAAPQPVRRRSSNRAASRRSSQSGEYNWRQLGKLVIVAWLIGGIVAVTWVKTINYPRAALLAGQAAADLQAKDLPAALSNLERATQLAPDVPVYYLFQSEVYTAYLQDPGLPPEQECSLQPEGELYKVCLVEKIYLNNLAATMQRPFYWRSRLALANSALALGRHEEAIQLYQETASSVPRSWPLLNRLAEAYVDIGQPAQALEVLEDSLAITQDTLNSRQALSLQSLAYEKLNDQETANPAP